MRRFIFRAFLVIAPLIVLGIGWIVLKAPPLPPGTDAAIDEVLASDVPELVTGETGTARSGEVGIWYERIEAGDSPRGTVLLIQGAGGHSLHWPSYFFRPLVEAGYRVVRYDNRGNGMSDWMPDWAPEAPYNLEDMARDGLAVLDELGIARAHIVGISMGGMIGQRLAVSYPDRVASLTSIASSGWASDPEYASAFEVAQSKMFYLFLRYGLIPTERSGLKVAVAFMTVLKGSGDYNHDVPGILQGVLYERLNHRGSNPAAIEQHTAAVEGSGSRLDELGRISAPTLVIHGGSDPLLLVGHARKYSPLIPGARLLIIPGMGHDLPSVYTPQMHEAMLELFDRTEGQLAVDSPNGR